MSEPLSALTVARFLQDNPAFFSEHADLFAALTVPHPNQARAISLGERQIMTLRDRQKDLEHRLAALSYQAGFNEGVANKLNQWCEILLAAQDAHSIPDHIIAGLASVFDIPEVTMRLWGLDIDEEGVGQAVDDDAKSFAGGLTAPYCGPNKDFSVASWLNKPAKSLAMIPLTRVADAEKRTIGLLLLASDDEQRFTPDMGTTFLQTVGQLSSAALRRLPLKAPA